MDWLDGHLGELQILTGLIRAAANMGVFIVVCLAWAEVNAGGMTPQGFVIPVLITFPLLTIFAVGVPHALAVHTGEPVLAKALPLLARLHKLLRPLAKVVEGIELVTRRLLGHRVPTIEDASERAEQEILDAVSEGEAQGAVNEEQKELIASVFQLDETSVSQIMTQRTEIDAVPADATYEDVRNLILREGHSRVPVYEESVDHIIGVLYAKDLLRLRSPEGFNVRRVMRRPLYVPETKSISDLLSEFRSKKVQIAVALDEYGVTAGIATIEDILEELVGEIDDEYDQPTTPSINRVSEDTYEVDGRVALYEINEELGLELPAEGGYETIGGFVFSTLGRIPKSGEEFQHENVRFRVVAAEPRRIGRLQIQVLREAQTA
jgi:putative hemolysin